MENKGTKLFITNDQQVINDLEQFKKLEYTETNEITNLPPEPVPYVTCPICDSAIDYESGSHPVFYYRCNKCDKNIKVEVRDNV